MEADFPQKQFEPHPFKDIEASDTTAKSARPFAIMVYAGVIVVFLSVIMFAVTTVSKMEAEKEGFRAIEVSKPISFIDNTYVSKPASR